MTNKKWFILLVVAIAIFIIANAINILLVQREPSIPATTFSQTNVDKTRSTFNQISFTGSTPDLPQSLPVATTQKFTTSANDITTLIVEEFNLIPHAKVPDLWTSDTWALSKSNANNLFILSINQFDPVSESNMNPEITKNTARNFMEKYFKQLNLQQISSDTIYYENVIEPTESTADKAEVAEIPFSYTIGGYPVFYEQNSLHPFIVWVSAKQEVLKFSFYPQFIQLQEIGSKPLISIDQAIENINTKNLGSVVNYDNTSTTIVDLNSVVDGELSSVKIEYRVDSTNNLSYPFYRFSGTAVLTGVRVPLEITTPAVVVE